MNLSRSISRFGDYYRRNGVRATVRRIGVAARRSLLSSRMVLFYCDLSTIDSQAPDLPVSMKVERKKSEAELSVQNLQEIASVWNPDLALRNMRERFHLGASLWLIKSEDNLAGYGWTLEGRTVEPHYFPLGERDVQFLDFHLFQRYRGRGMDWLLMNHIFFELRADGVQRVFGEAAEWNQASLSSFRMASFHRLGLARKFSILGQTIVCWADKRDARKDTKRHIATAGPGNRA